MGGWKNANQVETVWLRAFLYGPLGSGKTFTIAGFPAPVIVLPPSEGSIASLQGLDIPYRILGEEDPMKIADELRAVVDELAAADRRKTLHAEYGQTIVFENLSHLGDSLIAAWTQGGKVQPDQRTWGLLRTTMMYMRDVLFRLKAHVIFTALDKVTTDQSGAITFAGPRISGAAAELLPSSCDLVGVCEQVNSRPPKWQIHFQNFGAFKGRTRLAGMPSKAYASGDGSSGHPTIFQQIAAYLPQHQEVESSADDSALNDA